MSQGLDTLAKEAAKYSPKFQATYTIRNAYEILTMDLPPRRFVWADSEITPGHLTEVIGPPGNGKSRLLFFVAIKQIIAVYHGEAHPYFPTADWPLSHEPLRWLFLGTENGIRRWQTELRKITAKMSSDERRSLIDHLFLPTLESAWDCDMNLADEDNAERMTATIREYKPDVIVFDPWGDIIAGEEINDHDVRGTIKTLRHVIARSGNADVAVFILNHSRGGVAEFAKAAGADGMNYGRNSKAIYSVCRSVVNCRPINLERIGAGMELIHAKHNDTAGLPTVAIRLNGETMEYEPIADWNAAEWQDELNQLAGLRQGQTATRAKRLTSKEIDQTLKEVADMIAALPNAITRTNLVARLMGDRKITKDSARQMVDALAEADLGIQTYVQNFPKTIYFGTAEQIKKVEEKDAINQAARRGRKKEVTQNEQPL
jgi:hypothetical protein